MALQSYSEELASKKSIIRTTSPKGQLSYVVNKAGHNKAGVRQYQFIFRVPVEMAKKLGWTDGDRVDILWDSKERTGALVKVQRGGFQLAQYDSKNAKHFTIMAPYSKEANWPFLRSSIPVENVTVDEAKGILFTFQKDLKEDQMEQVEKRAAPQPLPVRTHTPTEIGVGQRKVGGR